MKKVPVIANLRPSKPGSHSDAFKPIGRRFTHPRTVISVAVVALLAACTTPLVSADYAADKKKYDDCVARERDRNAGSVASTYIESSIRNNCGEPPTRPKDEKK
jgi:hypothetical protein